MRISDWSSDVCSSDLEGGGAGDGSVRDAAGPSAADRLRRDAGVDRGRATAGPSVRRHARLLATDPCPGVAEGTPGRLVRRDGGSFPAVRWCPCRGARSEEHTSELQSLMRISYAVFCLQKKNKQ